MTGIDILVFLEAALAAFLVGILAVKGLAPKDPWLVAYLSWFAVLTVALWAFWLAKPEPVTYAWAYFSLNFIGLILVGQVIARASGEWWFLLLGAFFGCVLPLIGRQSLVQMLFAVAASYLVCYGIAGLWISGRMWGEFDTRLLQGIGLFCFTQGILFASYWLTAFHSIRMEELQQKVAFGAAILGSLAFLWMIWSFTTIQPESSRQSGSNPALYEGPAVLVPEISMRQSRRITRE